MPLSAKSSFSTSRARVPLRAMSVRVAVMRLPVIAAVSRKAGVRPERPLSISVIAGFLGVVASPISAATVALIGALASQEVSLGGVLAVTLPSTFLGVLAGAFSVAWRGKALADDPEAQAHLAAGGTKAPAGPPPKKKGPGGPAPGASGPPLAAGRPCAPPLPPRAALPPCA